MMSQKTLIILSISALTLLSGCASDPTWRKEGISSEDAVSTLSECKYQVGLSKVKESEQEDLVENCMQAKGFRK